MHQWPALQPPIPRCRADMLEIDLFPVLPGIPPAAEAAVPTLLRRMPFGSDKLSEEEAKQMGEAAVRSLVAKGRTMQTYGCCGRLAELATAASQPGAAQAAAQQQLQRARRALLNYMASMGGKLDAWSRGVAVTVRVRLCSEHAQVPPLPAGRQREWHSMVVRLSG